MNKKRRNLIGVLSLLPISSIAFARAYAESVSVILRPKIDYEKEMLRRLEEGTLSAKYYDFLDRHGVEGSEMLQLKSFAKHRRRLTTEFISDIYDPETDPTLAASNMSAIPPD